MRNPVKNAIYSILHNRRHLVFAIYRRLPWLIPNDKLYLKIYYWLDLKKKLDLEHPKTFNEKLQWMKIYDRNPQYTMMVDKYLVKEHVASIIGPEYVIPTIAMWKSPDEVDWSVLPEQFVLKTNHDGGCNGIVVCKDKNVLDKKKAVKELRRSFRRSSYMIGREWPYKNVKKVVFAEKYMEDSKTRELRDYKFFCFDGEAKAMYVASSRNSKDGVRFDFFDADFNHLDLTQGKHQMSQTTIEKPESFELMKELASKLSKGIPQVRIDFYEVDGHPYFGEYTFFHLGGTGQFNPESYDYAWGEWIRLPKKNDSK